MANMVKEENLEPWEKIIYDIMVSGEKLTSSQVEKLFETKKSHIPKSLFKYRECSDKSFKCLLGNYLCSSNPSSFNDPFDSTFNINNLTFTDIKPNPEYKKIKFLYFFNKNGCLKKINNIHFLNFINSENFINFLQKPVEDEESFIFQRESYWKYVIRYLDSNLFIQSFSEINDSILMWGHYADSHKGFCIEYDVSNLIEKEDENNGLYPIFYSDDYCDLSLCIGFYIIENKKDNPFNFIFPSLVKYYDWEYEKEWRYVEWLNIKRNPDSDFKVIKKLKMGQIKSIYLGVNILPKNEKFLIDFAKKNNISVYKMYQSIDNISLKYYPIYY